MPHTGSSVLHASAVQGPAAWDNPRYLATLFAPSPLRQALWTLLEFNNELARVREAVSQPILGQIRLQWWRDVLSEIYEGREVRPFPLALQLAACVSSHRLSRSLLEALIDAREHDLVDLPFAEDAGLATYAEASGGRLCQSRLEILIPDDAMRQAAGKAVECAGSAWAWTGIIRSIAFHARFDRVLIPAAILDRHGLAPSDVLGGQISPGLRQATEWMVRQARDKLGQAARLSPCCPRKAFPAFLEASLAGHYLSRVEKASFDPFDARIQQPLPAAIWIMMGAYMRRRL